MSNTNRPHSPSPTPSSCMPDRVHRRRRRRHPRRRHRRSRGGRRASRATTTSWIDARGAYLMPGVIDLHNDSLEVEINPRPETNLPLEFALANLERRLLFSGVTTEFHAIAFMNNARAGRTVAQRGGSARPSSPSTTAPARQLVDNQILHRLDVWSPGQPRHDLRVGGAPGRALRLDQRPHARPGPVPRPRRLQRAHGRPGPSAARPQGVHRRRRRRAHARARNADTETMPQVYRRIWRRVPSASASRSPPTTTTRRTRSMRCNDLGARVSEFPVDDRRGASGRASWA